MKTDRLLKKEVIDRIRNDLKQQIEQGLAELVEEVKNGES